MKQRGRRGRGPTTALRISGWSADSRQELRLFRWAQDEGYDLAVIYQGTDEGSIAVLTELVEELKRNGDRLVVVPSIEHFGTSPLLQEHLWGYVVHTANAEVREAANQQ